MSLAPLRRLGTHAFSSGSFPENLPANFSTNPDRLRSTAATYAGGRLTVWSELDSGTEVELRIPAARASSCHFNPASATMTDL
jgi:hypothetical protein